MSDLEYLLPRGQSHQNHHHNHNDSYDEDGLVVDTNPSSSSCNGIAQQENLHPYVPKYSAKDEALLRQVDLTHQDSIHDVFFSQDDEHVFVPKHICGIDTDFSFVAKKMEEFRQMSAEQKQREQKRWDTMPRWERHMYEDRIAILMQQRAMLELQAPSSSSSSFGRSSATTPASRVGSGSEGVLATTTGSSGNNHNNSCVPPTTTSLSNHAGNLTPKGNKSSNNNVLMNRGSGSGTIPHKKRNRDMAFEVARKAMSPHKTPQVDTTTASAAAVNLTEIILESPASSSVVVNYAEIPDSKKRCLRMKPPIPSRYQGDVEAKKDAAVPEFITLMNFPSLSLPENHRCCVMCGTACPTAAAVKAKKGPGRAGSKTNTEVAFIPTQNKGLCTLCDVHVWIIGSSGMEIKWCKGCKNFRCWAAFGDKGHATKCMRCRERQREKYAAQKEEKEKTKGGSCSSSSKTPGKKGRDD